MFDCSPGNLLKEIEQSMTVVKHHTAKRGDLIARYTANYFRESGPIVHENNTYEFLALNVPKIVWNNPRVAIQSMVDANGAAALQVAMNRWIKSVRLYKTLMMLCYDAMFGFGVAITAREPQPGVDPQANDGIITRPGITRIEPSWFFADVLAVLHGRRRFAGHICVEDKEDLLNQAGIEGSGWNFHALEAISPDSNLEKLGRDSTAKDLARKEIVYYETWVPEYRLPNAPGPEEGFNGTIFTVAAGTPGETHADMIRAPRPAFCPRWGPYTMFGFYPVPGSMFPLSPIVANAQLSQDLNDQVAAVKEADDRYKKITLVDAANPSLKDGIKNAKNGDVVPVGNLTKGQAEDKELGGSSEMQHASVDRMQGRLDRNSGMHEAQRGNVTGKGTATEVGVAEESSTVRSAFLKQLFAEPATEVLRNAAWFMQHDSDVQFDVAPGVRFYGGIHPEAGQTAQDFDELELEIEPYSMERISEGLAQKRATEAVEVVVTIAPLAREYPEVDWRKLLRTFGESRNIKDFDQILNTEMGQQIVQMQQAQEEATAARDRETQVLTKTVGKGGKSGAPPAVQNAAERGQIASAGAAA